MVPETPPSENHVGWCGNLDQFGSLSRFTCQVDKFQGDYLPNSTTKVLSWRGGFSPGETSLLISSHKPLVPLFGFRNNQDGYSSKELA
jgi:hypothetical protein